VVEPTEAGTQKWEVYRDFCFHFFRKNYTFEEHWRFYFIDMLLSNFQYNAKHV
jgi:hypothetical protein